MNTKKNRRNYDVIFKNGKHLTVEELKNSRVKNDYLHLNMPPYPKPEFHLNYVSHDTNEAGVRGISRNNGFRNPYFEGSLKSSPKSSLDNSLLWWSLVVTPNDIESAENRLLEATYPDCKEKQRQIQPTFLANFATSEAFTETSRLGNFRFTFPLREVLDAYSEQFCSGGNPVMRVYKTSLYQKEVSYAVLVHSPGDNERFSGYPLLTEDSSSVCGYNGEMGYIIWKPEAMCGDHKYQLVKNDQTQQMTAEERPRGDGLRYFIWDNVALAFCVDEKVLTFDHKTLGDNLTITGKSYPSIAYENCAEPLMIIQELWPDYQLHQKIPDKGTEEVFEEEVGDKDVGEEEVSEEEQRSLAQVH